MPSQKNSGNKSPGVQKSEEQQIDLIYRVDKQYWGLITKDVIDLIQSRLQTRVKISKSSNSIYVQESNLSKVVFLIIENYILKASRLFGEYIESEDSYECVGEVLDSLSSFYTPNGGYSSRAMPLCIGSKSEALFARSPGQDELALAIRVHDFIICHGAAGSGKTTVAASIAADLLCNGRVDKIIITRPAVEAGSQKIGYLPGTKEEKLDPFIRPLKDAIENIVGKQKYIQLCHDDKIEIAPMSFIRGRSFNSAFIIADEMQNSTIDEMFTLLTRVGNLSKIVCLGDLTQEDNNARIKGANGLDKAIRIFKDDKRVSIIKMDNSDIQRSWIVEAAISGMAI